MHGTCSRHATSCSSGWPRTSSTASSRCCVTAVRLRTGARVGEGRWARHQRGDDLSPPGLCARTETRHHVFWPSPSPAHLGALLPADRRRTRGVVDFTADEWSRFRVLRRRDPRERTKWSPWTPTASSTTTCAGSTRRPLTCSAGVAKSSSRRSASRRGGVAEEDDEDEVVRTLRERLGPPAAEIVDAAATEPRAPAMRENIETAAS